MSVFDDLLAEVRAIGADPSRHSELLKLDRA